MGMQFSAGRQELGKTPVKLGCWRDSCLLFDAGERENTATPLSGRWMHLHLCWMWSQCVPECIGKWCGVSDHNQSSKHFECIHTCTFRGSSAIRMQSDHRKSIWNPGVKALGLLFMKVLEAWRHFLYSLWNLTLKSETITYSDYWLISFSRRKKKKKKFPNSSFFYMCFCLSSLTILYLRLRRK